MNLIALIFAFSFSLFNFSDTYVLEHSDKEIREVYVSQFSLNKQQVDESTKSQAPFLKFEESIYLINYDYVPVTKHLFLKTRILLL